jgi:hypothetical protein
MAILKWSQMTPVKWHCIQPGKPQQNAIELHRPNARRVPERNGLLVVVGVRTRRPRLKSYAGLTDNARQCR